MKIIFLLEKWFTHHVEILVELFKYRVEDFLVLIYYIVSQDLCFQMSVLYESEMLTYFSL